MSFTLIWISFIIAIIDWLAVAKKWRPLECIAKPAVIIALLAWLWSIGGVDEHLKWFALGLIFSLAGDILFMHGKKST